MNSYDVNEELLLLAIPKTLCFQFVNHTRHFTAPVNFGEIEEMSRKIILKLRRIIKNELDLIETQFEPTNKKEDLTPTREEIQATKLIIQSLGEARRESTQCTQMIKKIRNNEFTIRKIRK